MHLQAVRELTNQTNSKGHDSDRLYDTELQRLLNTKVWHPPME